MNVQEIVNVSIGLSATPASQAKFTVPILLVDDSNVPLDRRYRTVTRTSYATTLTSATAAYNWCAALWGQNYNPTTAYIGRWVNAATSPYAVCVGFETTIATWAAISDGSLTVTTNAGADAVTACDFTGVTTLAGVAAVIDAKIVAGGNSGARCTVDALSRIIFTDAGETGTSAYTVALSGGGPGTDLYLPASLNGVDSFQQGGLDAEAQGTALAAILALDNSPFAVCQIGGTDAQIAALSTYVNSQKKILIANQYTTTAKSSGTTTDFGYLTNQLSHKQTFAAYTEQSTDNNATAIQYPDAALCGEILPRVEASTNFALTPLTSVSESGLDPDGSTVIPLTSDECTALAAKGYDYLVTPSGSTHFVRGLAVDGSTEMRIIIGKMYMEAKISEDVYGYLIANDVVTFSDKHLSAIKGIITFWADEMVDREVLESGYVITMPSAADFTAAQKATHTLPLSDLSDQETQRSVNDVTISLTWAV